MHIFICFIEFNDFNKNNFHFHFRSKHGILKMKTKTSIELCFNSRELRALYLAYNSMNDRQILIDYKKCLTEAL